MNPAHLLAAGVISAFACAGASTPQTTYFGEPQPGLAPSVQASVSAGRDLFVRLWDTPESARNRSCLSCHEVPMPGGSGIHRSTFVSAEIDDSKPTGFRVVFSQPDASKSQMKLKPPALFGLGLIEKATCEGRCAMGNIGYRGRIKSIDEFVAAAFIAELGVTVKPDAVLEKNEISPEQVAQVAEFIRYLAPPPVQAAAETSGQRIFEQIGCASCHHPRRKTHSGAPLGLRDTEFSPFSDFRSHRVRPEMEYPVRTAPLWGLSYTGPPYLHDGAADTLERAITAHGVEATSAAERYKGLTGPERASMLRFLKSL